MKLGISMLCVSGFIEARHVEQFELARTHGYDGVDIPLMSGTPKHYERLARFLDELHLDRTTTLILSEPSMNPASTDPVIRQQGIDRLNWAIDCAEALGASSIGGPFHVPIKLNSAAPPTEEALQNCAEAHHDMAERAQQLGIQLSLEPLNRDETLFLNTMEQAADYARRVDHANFRILYDTFHAQIEESDPVSAADRIRDHLGVVHVSENDHGIPGRGQVDFAGLFQVLKRNHFDNWLIVEAFSGKLPDISIAKPTSHTLFPDLTTLFRESAQLVRERWAMA